MTTVSLESPGKTLTPCGTPASAKVRFRAEALKEPLDAEDGLQPILVMVDQDTGATFSYVVTKGVNNYAVHVMNEARKFTGRQRVVIMSDGEPAVRALIDTVARQAGRETQVQHAPKETHGRHTDPATVQPRESYPGASGSHAGPRA